jgi:hypothetical protein
MPRTVAPWLRSRRISARACRVIPRPESGPPWLPLSNEESQTDIARKQPASLRDPQSGGIKQPQQDPIERFCVRFHQPANVFLADNPFRQPFLVAGQSQLRGGIGENIRHSQAEPEQALHCRQDPGSRNGCQARLHQRLREALEIPQGQTAQPLRYMVEEPSGVAPLAPTSMWAGLALEPELDDVRIAVRYHNPPYGLFAVVTFMPRV